MHRHLRALERAGRLRGLALPRGRALGHGVDCSTYVGATVGEVDKLLRKQCRFFRDFPRATGADMQSRARSLQLVAPPLRIVSENAHALVYTQAACVPLKALPHFSECRACARSVLRRVVRLVMRMHETGIGVRQIGPGSLGVVAAESAGPHAVARALLFDFHGMRNLPHLVLSGKYAKWAGRLAASVLLYYGAAYLPAPEAARFRALRHAPFGQRELASLRMRDTVRAFLTALLSARPHTASILRAGHALLADVQN